ncbi:MAG: hypothetical protein K6G88_10335 [Lachnospiraceae bacterium]|nr:hypothetical protein [Lachnospiraceae bacterium]
MLNEKNNNVSNDNELIGVLIAGKDALDRRDWENASLFFSDALRIDEKCGDAYYGAWMAKYHANSPKNMVDVFVEKYDEPYTVVVDFYKDHINKMVEKYEVLRYLPANLIIKKYDYYKSTSIESTVASRVELKERAIGELMNESLWMKAKEYGTPSLQKRVDMILSEIEKKLEAKIEQANEDYMSKNSEVAKVIGEKIKTADEKVINEYNKAVDRREKDYNKAVMLCNGSRSNADIEKAIRLFERVRGYKESEDYLIKCLRIRKEPLFRIDMSMQNIAIALWVLGMIIANLFL